MPVGRTGRQLLYSIRKHKDRATLYDLPDNYLDSQEEHDAVVWLRAFVNNHKRFPTKETMQRETGIPYLSTSEPPSYYVEVVRKRALYSGFLEPYKNLREALQDKDPDEALVHAREIVSLANRINAREEGVVNLRDAAFEVLSDYEVAKHTIGTRGIPTNMPYVDKVTDGLQNADLITIVGRPGRGKSSIALNWAYNAWIEGKSVLFLSMEMGVLQVARRLVGQHTRINPRLIQRGRLSTRGHRHLVQNINTMPEEADFHIMAGNFRKSIPSLRGQVEEHQPDVIFADASYLLQPEKKSNSTSRRESIADVIEDLKSLALDVDRPLVQTVQFNRQAERSQRSTQAQTDPLAHLSLAKIGETDVIGQASSLVFGLELGDQPHQDDQRYLGLLKGREGEKGWVKINYKFEPYDFSEITNDERHRATGGDEALEEPDLSYMDVRA